MLEGRVIRRVDVSAASFAKCLRRIRDQQRQRDIIAGVRQLLMLDLDRVPAKLHLHQLSGKSVPSAIGSERKVAVWTFHVTPDDRYKASFTLEDGTAYLRLCDEHDVIDKNP